MNVSKQACDARIAIRTAMRWAYEAKSSLEVYEAMTLVDEARTDLIDQGFWT